MAQRLNSTMKWLWCILIIYSGPAWSPVRCVTVRSPPKNPTTVEAQAKFFQDFFSVQLSPYKIEFGHVCEDPNTWEQRYEKKDFKNHRDMGKVRWGDKKGGYGEHYWDLNHAGHAGNHGDDGYYNSDDGSYHENDENDSYDEPSEQSPNYQADEYDPEAASKYEENNRAKRADAKSKVQKTENDKKRRRAPQKQIKNNEQSEAAQDDDEYEAEASSEKETYQTVQNPKKPTQPSKISEEEQPRGKDDIVLVVGQKEKENRQKHTQFVPQVEPKHYVPYEGGAGVRHHQHAEVQAAAPRLFLEPSTGHVVDRATGQAYVLQPLVPKSNYS
ncbi:serrate RNA effector molecule homolog [Battus philenor]|uniref:serrate RNA effector molecule homolog n=1 Tax=Battus philenor TaxID=42288 RepID=UPI0035D00F56